MHYIPPDWRAILRQHGFEVSDLGAVWPGTVLLQSGSARVLSTWCKSRGRVQWKFCADREVILENCGGLKPEVQHSSGDNVLPCERTTNT